MTNIVALPVNDNGARAANINDAQLAAVNGRKRQFTHLSPISTEWLTGIMPPTILPVVAVDHRIFISDKNIF